jgi:hypothetical protein
VARARASLSSSRFSTDGANELHAGTEDACNEEADAEEAFASSSSAAAAVSSACILRFCFFCCGAAGVPSDDPDTEAAASA